IKDEKGNPVKGSFAVSVSDEKSYNQADDKQGNILAHLLLCQDIKGEVEEPAFYFNKEQEKAAEALDLVMMTNGWRRIDWRQLLNSSAQDWSAAIKYTSDLFALEGFVFYANQKPMRNAEVTLKGTSWKTHTDSAGKFLFAELTAAENYTLFAKKKMKHAIFQTSMNNLALKRPEIKVSDIKKEKENSTDIIAFGKNSTPTPLKTDVVSNVERAYKLPVLKEVEIAQQLEVMPGVQSTLQLDEVQIVSKQRHANYRSMSIDAVAIRSASDVSSSALLRVGGLGWNSQYYSDYNLHFDNSVLHSGEAQAKPFISIPRVNTYPFGITPPKTFYIPNYYPNTSNNNYINRNDHRKTIFWKPDVFTDSKGEATVKLNLNDDPGTFRITLEGVSENGELAYFDDQLASRPSVNIKASLPVFVSTGDRSVFSVTLTNNTRKALSGKLKSVFEKGLVNSGVPSNIVIPADSYVVVNVSVNATNSAGKKNVQFSFEAEDGSNSQTNQTVEIIASGFPVEKVFSDKKPGDYEFVIDNPKDTNVTTVFEIYPNMVGEFLSTVKSMMHEPHGCFEQVSSGNYPNVMALRILKASNVLDAEIEGRALDLLRSGFRQMVAYETKEGGFEWWGRSPSHVTLTAFGLMQFKEMQEFEVGVDQNLLQRTIAHLLGKMEADGGFVLNNNALDGFHGTRKNVSDAYVTWALSEFRTPGIDKCVSKVEKDLDEKFDIYRATILAMIYTNINQHDKSKKLLDKIEAEIVKNGIEKTSAEVTLTSSYGTALNLETVCLYAIAKMKETNAVDPLVINIVNYATKNKSAYGYGSTQSTAMVMKMFEQFTLLEKPSKGKGDIELYVNGNLFKSMEYNSEMFYGITENIPYSSLKSGKNTVSVKFANKSQSVMYSLKNKYFSYRPLEEKNCNVNIAVSSKQTEVKKGEVVNMEVILTNKKNSIIPQTIARITVPAGCQVNMNQLKELKDKKVFDYFHYIQ
ncbi:MAG: hypothetical protein IAF38_19350, partial [Bacteroidia bacterium]|nr:hypothetical protein [Bacteroidia bacterium]